MRDRWHALSCDLADAWSGLMRRPLRSVLSSIGIAIGVAALVSMLSIGEGARQQALDQVRSLGINTVRLENAAQAAQSVDRSLANLSQGLNHDALGRIRVWLGVRGVLSEYTRVDDVVLERDNRRRTATVLGVDGHWLRAEELRVGLGRPLARPDFDARARVCVVGAALGAQLGLAPGDSLRMQGEICTVVGLLLPKGRLLTEGTGLSGLDFDRAVVMPGPAFPFPRAPGQVDAAVIRLFTEDEGAILSLAGQLDQQLLELHRGVRDYQVVTPATLMREARQTQRLFALVMGSIAGLSLLVGGIGIMNVMLANLAEQTREIGLRIAVGASRPRIVSLFLLHAVLLTAVGGALGVFAGVAIAIGVQSLAHWPVAFSWDALVVGPLYAVVAGMLFGYYPAHRAASLNPALALREA